jgi:2-phospho-L-lactate guanylyltransferase
MRSGVWAVVPAKGFSSGKSRLAPLLPPGPRAELARTLVEHVLSVLARCPLAGVLVLTDSDEVAGRAAAHGALVRREEGPAPLAQLVDEGLRDVISRGATAALVLMSDLPHLAPADVAGLLEALACADVVVAPDHREAGTGALALAPPDVLATCFGRPDSFSRHVDAARSAGSSLAAHRSPGLAFDLDAPADHARAFGGR